MQWTFSYTFKISFHWRTIMANILVVDDEKNIVKGIKFSLEQDGMKVDMAHDGEEALQMARDNSYDLIILDVMLPKIEGTDVCRQIREFSAVPVVMVTAKGDDMDKIMGLEYGADDYITKPFNILELKARIKAILRRASREKPVAVSHLITVRDVKLDSQARRVFVSDVEIYLTAKEYDLLEFLMNNEGKVYTRENLLTQLWGDNTGDVRTVDVHVRRLREKIEENPSDPKYIYTKWGVGYYFR
jgi:DNA-binding response OmpR family regulator